MGEEWDIEFAGFAILEHCVRQMQYIANEWSSLIHLVVFLDVSFESCRVC